MTLIKESFYNCYVCVSGYVHSQYFYVSGLDTYFWHNSPLWKVCVKIYFPQQKISFPKWKEPYFLLAIMVVDKTLTPSPWTTLMDYPNGLPKWTTLKWTTPKNTDEYYIKKLRFYTYTARTCIFLFRMAFSRHVE